MKKRYVRVPEIMQMENVECGAASLAMILAYYGRWVPLERVRIDCGVSRDGSNALNLLKAGRTYGLEAAAYRYENIEEMKEEVEFPCIIHWEFCHFVVLCGFKKNRAVLNDPARGRVEVSMEEFDQSFTGICLTFKPGEDFIRSGKRASIAGFVKKRLHRDKKAFLMVLTAGMASALLGIFQPVMMRVFMDYILNGWGEHWVYPFFGLFFAVALLQLVVSIVSSLQMILLEGKFSIKANSEFLWHVLRLPMEFFGQRNIGDISARQQANEGIAYSMMNRLAPSVINGGMLIFYLVIMLSYSPLLSLIGTVSVCVNLGIAAWISRRRIQIARVQMRDEAKLVSNAVSGIEMIETIKANGVETGFFEKWAGYQAAVNVSEVSAMKLEQYIGNIPELIRSLADLFILMMGVWMILEGEFTIGMVVAFQGMYQRFIDPAEQLLAAGQKLQEMRTNMERIEDVLDYSPDVEYKKEERQNVGEEEYGKLEGSVEMRNVTFGYSRFGAPLIENFSIKINPGERVAFVGASGCGKSTLTRLISGLYQPWEGEIFLGGRLMQTIPREIFTGSLAVVDQNIVIFEDTVANNIKMWDNTIEDYEMILAARDAQIHDDIMKREDGYNTNMTEGGKNFSGGERQRIEIARVLANDPTIILMDEATSALDAQTEYDVVNAIKDRGITCVIVAHRLSTIRDCDQIFVMDKGRIVEHGTHEELYAKNGHYTKLVITE